MSQATDTTTTGWTAVDLVERFGPIALSRVLQNPPPGMATEQDVIALSEHENRLCELVDGALVEKTVGFYESYLAIWLAQLLGAYVRENRLGIVLGADALMRFAPGLVRIPDVSFVSWVRLPGRRIPRQPIADLAPDLAVEVISKYNTREEMDRKLRDYFAAGVRMVWHVHHSPRREVWVYVKPEEYSVVREGQTLDGGKVLPGFELPLAELFAEPAGPED